MYSKTEWNDIIERAVFAAYVAEKGIPPTPEQMIGLTTAMLLDFRRGNPTALPRVNPAEAEAWLRAHGLAVPEKANGYRTDSRPVAKVLPTAAKASAPAVTTPAPKANVPATPAPVTPAPGLSAHDAEVLLTRVAAIDAENKLKAESRVRVEKLIRKKMSDAGLSV